MSFMYPVIAQVAHEAQSTESAYTIYTYLFSILNVLVLFYLLKLILFKPVTRVMQERTENIKKNIENAKNDAKIADDLKAEYQLQLDNARDEVEITMNEARKKANAEGELIIQSAKKQADQILEKAQERGEREVQLALSDIKNQVTTLSLQAASKILEKNMNSEENKKLVEQFLDEVGVA